MTAGPQHEQGKRKAAPTLAALVLIAGALAAMLALSGVQAATPTFVQGRAKEITSGTTNSLAFNSANTAGNLIVVYVAWGNTGAVTLSDSSGNAYAAVAPARAGATAMPGARRSSTQETSPAARIRSRRSSAPPSHPSA